MGDRSGMLRLYVCGEQGLNKNGDDSSVRFGSMLNSLEDAFIIYLPIFEVS